MIENHTAICVSYGYKIVPFGYNEEVQKDGNTYYLFVNLKRPFLYS